MVALAHLLGYPAFLIGLVRAEVESMRRVTRALNHWADENNPLPDDLTIHSFFNLDH